MTQAKEEILKQALDLKPVERAELIEQLPRSFDKAGAEAIDVAWAEKAESRIDACDAGILTADTANEVCRNLLCIQAEPNVGKDGESRL